MNINRYIECNVKEKNIRSLTKTSTEREEAVIRIVAFYFESSAIAEKEEKRGNEKWRTVKTGRYSFAFSPRENLLRGTLEYHLLPFISRTRSRVLTSFFVTR